MVYYMKWKLNFTNRCAKATSLLDEKTLKVLQVLVVDLEAFGPFPGKRWPNYGKLTGSDKEDRRHCHLLKGRPTYVCCWRVLKKERVIEVYYVGTHEKAPY